ncbi:MAG: hypothetical protein Q7T57_08075, partial [Dehalococcoidales bacterium]|nr:hypothetical protein [Dehalococcoidales bacterium]
GVRSVLDGRIGWWMETRSGNGRCAIADCCSALLCCVHVVYYDCCVQMQVMIDNWQWRDPRVAELYSKGKKGLLAMRSMIQQNMVEERMRQLRSFNELDLDCFQDWRLAFELCLAVHKVEGGGGSEADMHLLNVLAAQMYQDIHLREAKSKILIGLAIAGVIALAPWCLHKLGYGKRAAQ